VHHLSSSPTNTYQLTALPCHWWLHFVVRPAKEALFCFILFPLLIRLSALRNTTTCHRPETGGKKVIKDRVYVQCVILQPPLATHKKRTPPSISSKNQSREREKEKGKAGKKSTLDNHSQPAFSSPLPSLAESPPLPLTRFTNPLLHLLRRPPTPPPIKMTTTPPPPENNGSLPSHIDVDVAATPRQEHYTSSDPSLTFSPQDSNSPSRAIGDERNSGTPPLSQSQLYGNGGGMNNFTSAAAAAGGQGAEAKRNSVVIKVGMVGDAQIGKTSLMVKYVEGSFDEDYIQTLGLSPSSSSSSSLSSYTHLLLTACHLLGNPHFPYP
jgi:hypothetical protein